MKIDLVVGTSCSPTVSAVRVVLTCLGAAWLSKYSGLALGLPSSLLGNE